MERKRIASEVAVAALLIAVAGCGEKQETAKPVPAQPAAQAVWEVPEPFEPVPVPESNPMTLAKVELGRKLYFDKRLSGDGTLSCYSCHVCESGLTDGRPTAIGAFGKAIGRAAPTMWNVGYLDSLYWDGRAASLEAQALAAWKGGNMGAKPDSIAAVLQADTEYAQAFQEVFQGEATPEHVTQALAAYMRSILCYDTAYDRYERGDKTAMSEAALRGWEIFRGKAVCATCHAGNLFTDQRYHNVGIGMSKENPDVGRFKVTQRSQDMGAFKTPTLRDVSRSAPYFHDGSVATLEEAVALMVAGGIDNPHKDPQLHDLGLTDAEKADLVAFLKALDCPCDPEALSLAPR